MSTLDCDHCGRGELQCDSSCSPNAVDLGDPDEFGALLQPCQAIPTGEVWTGPPGADPFRAFGPRTTAGGRAEAGWFRVGTIADDGLTMTTDDGDGVHRHWSADGDYLHTTHDGRAH